VPALVMLAVWLTGCAHYRAASLAVLSSSAVNTLDEAGFTLVAARLTDEDGVARVLGPRSRRLASAAVVVQLSVTAKDAPVELGAGALRLALPSGEVVDPLAPGRLAVFVPTRQIASSDPLRLLAELSVGPQRIERSLTLFGALRP